MAIPGLHQSRASWCLLITVAPFAEIWISWGLHIQVEKWNAILLFFDSKYLMMMMMTMTMMMMMMMMMILLIFILILTLIIIIIIIIIILYNCCNGTSYEDPTSRWRRQLQKTRGCLRPWRSKKSVESQFQEHLNSGHWPHASRSCGSSTHCPRAKRGASAYHRDPNRNRVPWWLFMCSIVHPTRAIKSFWVIPKCCKWVATQHQWQKQFRGRMDAAKVLMMNQNHQLVHCLFKVWGTVWGLGSRISFIPGSGPLVFVRSSSLLSLLPLVSLLIYPS